MGLTCSVLGHRYGDREHIEERDRQGSEEVIAVREVKTCERCGDELVVSESKEVIAVPQEVEEEVEVAPIEEPVEEPATEDPEPIDIVEAPEPQPGDEGIILTDNDDREPGEWPSLEEVEEEEEPQEIDWPDVSRARDVDVGDEDGDTPDPQPWPDVDEGDDEGFDATDRDEDVAGQILEATVSDTDVPIEQTDTGFIRAGEIDSPADPDDGDVHTEFFCPRCDWAAKALTTSVRRGDICPNCRTGYIAERSI